MPYYSCGKKYRLHSDMHCLIQRLTTVQTMFSTVQTKICMNEKGNESNTEIKSMRIDNLQIREFEIPVVLQRIIRKMIKTTLKERKEGSPCIMPALVSLH